MAHRDRLVCTAACLERDDSGVGMARQQSDELAAGISARADYADPDPPRFAHGAEYSAPVTPDDGRRATDQPTRKARAGADLPDFQLPVKGKSVGALSVRVREEADLVQLLVTLRDAGAEIVAINTFPATRGEADVQRVFDFEIRNIDPDAGAEVLRGLPGVAKVEARKTLGQIFGKRVIVIGGGAQVAQVSLGAVSEADRHNLRGERISVDTIALVGEQTIAAAVRAVADLPRAHILVLAGSIMGGEITTAVRELQQVGIPVISLNMAGSVPDAADLVVTDPVQAGTMAVMAIADTARFTIDRQRGRRY
jgi:energy-converting hydrogenase B subunit Q